MKRFFFSTCIRMKEFAIGTLLNAFVYVQKSGDPLRRARERKLREFQELDQKLIATEIANLVERSEKEEGELREQIAGFVKVFCAALIAK